MISVGQGDSGEMKCSPLKRDYDLPYIKLKESVFNSDRKNPLDVPSSVSLVNPFFIKSLPPLPYTQAAKTNY